MTWRLVHSVRAPGPLKTRKLSALGVRTLCIANPDEIGRATTLHVQDGGRLKSVVPLAANVVSNVRPLLFASLVAVTSLSLPATARADCSTAPLGSPDDLVVSFLAAQGGTQAAASTQFASSVKEGMLVYDDTTNALRYCDGTNWVTLVGSGGGGSATSAAGSTGQVQFNGGSGAFAADAALHWDNTNKRLGIGTATAINTLEVHTTTGNANIRVRANSTGAAELKLQASADDTTKDAILYLGNTDFGNGDGFTVKWDHDVDKLLISDIGGTNRVSFDTDGRVGIGTVSPNASALLDITSTTMGFLPPRMTTTQRNAISNPVEGLIIYNTVSDTLQYFTGSDWADIGAVESVNPITPILVSWGLNTAGELGNGTTTLSLYLGAVSSPPSNIASMNGGGYFYGTNGAFCVTTTSNALWCWGRQTQVLGEGGANQTTPFNSTSGFSWKKVDVGTHLASCGITVSDQVYCWGRQDTNGLGNGLNNTTTQDTPIGPLDSGSTWADVASGGYYNGSSHLQFGCGIKMSDNKIYCWGNDSYGQQGNNAGGNNYTAVPAAANSALTFKSVVAGAYHACAIDSSDDAYCWGRGDNGQLGNAASTNQQSPVAVSGGRKWSQLTAGLVHTCGIERDTKYAYCWGDGANNQLGNGPSGVDSNVPVAVIGAKKWTKIAAGRYQTCGIDSTSRIFCWGLGTSGQIGDGDTITRNAPTLVWGDYTFSDIAVSSDSALALTK